jgi:hypothetical protein
MLNRDKVKEIFGECMDMVGDVDYCASLVDVIIHTAFRRVFKYSARGRSRPVFYLALPHDVDYKVGILTDKTKKTFIILLHAPLHAVSLIYEREGDGRFALRRAAVSNMEYAAIMNGPLGLTSEYEGGGP